MRKHRDPLIEEVRRARMELSAEFGHDIRKLGAFLRKEEQKHPKRLLAPETTREIKGNRPGSSRRKALAPA